ncbi:DegT/DnrJ/EryC1/StrS family aminotransferase [Bacteroides uniformis]|nr:DegT/DnrJ/EryC1/StrS family aminotransferase [Bacteroides uniformis]
MDKTIYLCLAHMSEEGIEQKYVKEAFDTNWVVPLGPNVNAFEEDLKRFVGEGKEVVALSAGTAAVHLRSQLLNSRTVRLDGLGTFTMKARTRGKGVAKSEDVNPNQVTALRCQFTPEYTRPAAIGTTRALLQGVEFEKWTGVVTDGKDDAGDGGNSGGGSDGDQGENPLG